MTDMFFIGNKNNPSFMIEFNKKKKKVIIYKPDKYSLKTKDFLEHYTLGEILYETKYKKYYYIKKKCQLFNKTNTYFNLEEDVFLLNEIIILLNDKYLLVRDSIYEKLI